LTWIKHPASQQTDGQCLFDNPTRLPDFAALQYRMAILAQSDIRTKRLNACGLANGDSNAQISSTKAAVA